VANLLIGEPSHREDAASAKGTDQEMWEAIEPIAEFVADAMLEVHCVFLVNG
jgi:hypothetical protein